MPDGSSFILLGMCTCEMAKRETKVKGGTEAVGYFFFCAINWRHVKLHDLSTSKTGFLGEGTLVITLDQGGMDRCTACRSGVCVCVSSCFSLE